MFLEFFPVHTFRAWIDSEKSRSRCKAVLSFFAFVHAWTSPWSICSTEWLVWCSHTTFPDTSVTQMLELLVYVLLVTYIPWICRSVVMCFRYLGNTQKSFLALKTLCALPMHPFLPITSRERTPHCLQSAAFSRLSCSCDHAMCSFIRLANPMVSSYISEIPSSACQDG